MIYIFKKISIIFQRANKRHRLKAKSRDFIAIPSLLNRLNIQFNYFIIILAVCIGISKFVRPAFTCILVCITVAIHIVGV